MTIDLARAVECMSSITYRVDAGKGRQGMGWEGDGMGWDGMGCLSLPAVSNRGWGRRVG